MRDWIDLLENEYEPLAFFWYDTKKNEIRAFGDRDCDHAVFAAEHLGEVTVNSDDWWDWNSAQIDNAIANGWVRGRYNTRHDALKANLSLQGKPRDVAKTARVFSEKHPFGVLFLDFAEEGKDTFHGLDEKKCTQLTGDRLEYFLSKGRVPSAMVMEAPIEIHPLNFSDDVKSFHKDDVGIVTSDKGRAKIDRIWRTSVVDVVAYLYDAGVDPDDALDIAFGTRNPHTTSALATLSDLEGQVHPAPGKISVIFTNNAGFQRVPMTGWMVAHRLFHAFETERNSKLHQATDFEARTDVDHCTRQIRTMCDNLMMHAGRCFVGTNHLKQSPNRDDMAMAIGTSKSFRDLKIINGDYTPEFFAQYLLKGRVRLNKDVREFTGKDGWHFKVRSEEDYANFVDLVTRFEKAINEKMGELVKLATGKIFAA